MFVIHLPFDPKNILIHWLNPDFLCLQFLWPPAIRYIPWTKTSDLRTPHGGKPWQICEIRPESDELIAITESLQKLMETDQLFTNPELTLCRSVGKKLAIPRSHLTQAINTSFE
jgi:hypothetical protein